MGSHAWWFSGLCRSSADWDMAVLGKLRLAQLLESYTGWVEALPAEWGLSPGCVDCPISVVASLSAIRTVYSRSLEHNVLPNISVAVEAVTGGIKHERQREREYNKRTSNFRAIGGFGVCVPHWCPSQTYPKNAWNASGNVIDKYSSNPRTIGAVGVRVLWKHTAQCIHSVCSTHLQVHTHSHVSQLFAMYTLPYSVNSVCSVSHQGFAPMCSSSLNE